QIGFPTEFTLFDGCPADGKLETPVFDLTHVARLRSSTRVVGKLDVQQQVCGALIKIIRFKMQASIQELHFYTYVGLRSRLPFQVLVALVTLNYAGRHAGVIESDLRRIVR